MLILAGDTAERTDHPSHGEGGNYWIIFLNIFTRHCIIPFYIRIAFIQSNDTKNVKLKNRKLRFKGQFCMPRKNLN